jgi:cell wall-associated NlpC family hydrolase
MNRAVTLAGTAALTGVLVLGTVAPAEAAAPTLSARVEAKNFAAAQAGDRYSQANPQGPNHWDCSGLMQAAWKKAGKSLPRTAQGQYNSTRHVADSKKRIGDLVFFGGASSIYHVGIYAGGGKVWHSPRPGQKVKLEKIWEGYRVGQVR